MSLQPNPEAPRKHRTTIFRAARRLIQQAEGCSAGIYWGRRELDTWHPDDFDALAVRVSAAGVQCLEIRGELCFHVEP